MSLVEKLRATLRNVAESSKLEVEFGLPPKVKFALDGGAINAMQKTAQIISYELMLCFTDRQIFYDDLAYIDMSNLPKKFTESEGEFKEAAKYVFENGDPGRVHLAELFTACVPIIADHRRVIERAPGPESIKRAALSQIPKMRSEVVPYMETLAAFLPSNSITEERVVWCIEQARASMTPEQLEASKPRMRESS